MRTLLHDLRYAVRTLRTSPGFTLAAVLAIALGIGANTLVFGLMNALLFDPLPFEQADRLVMFWDENPQQGRFYNEVAPAHVAALEERARAFEAIAPYDYGGWDLTGTDEPERLAGYVVAHDFFPLLGVAPALGRGFLPEEDRDGAPAVAMLGFEFWQRRFAGDPAVVGSTIHLDGVATTVVGVLPEGFRFEARADVYAPLSLSDEDWRDRDNHYLRVVGRLAPGVGLGEARAETNTIIQAVERDHPGTGVGWRSSVVPAAEGLFQAPIRPGLLLLLGAVGFVLLIACADVAHLLLARATGRRKELAVRGALGASRGRLVRQLLTESAALALAGGGLGVLLAFWGIELLRAVFPPAMLELRPQVATMGIDGTALGYTALVTLATCLLFGILPALRAARTPPADSLRDDGHGATAGPSRHRLRAVLITAEVALSLVLVTGAGLMVRSLTRQLGANPGFRPDRVLTFWVSLPETRYPTGLEIAAFARRLEDRLRGLPGVEDVAVANVIPLSGEDFTLPFTIDGTAAQDEGEPPAAGGRMVSGDYFRALGIPLHRGRAFDDGDTPDSPPVAVIGQGMARRWFPGVDPIGRRITIPDFGTREIVGIVGDIADWRLGGRSDAFLYLPFQQLRSRRMGVMIRSTTPPAGLAGAAREAVAALDADQPVYDLRPMDALLDEALAGSRFVAAMMSAFAFLALVLAAVGIYGVTASAIGQRTHEIGIRVALGARASTIRAMVLRQGLRPVSAGLAIGLAGSFVLSRAVRRLLFEISPTDPLTFLAVAGLLAAVAAAAILVPARRATRVDPMVALRSG